MDFPPHVKPYLEQVERQMEDDLGKEDARVYGLLAPFVKRGGKRIRPALMLLSCSAAGGDCRAAVGPAAIIELFHNFTLIHDDIEDDSQFRRGVPALHVTHGVAMALNSGDALYTLIWRNLLSLGMPASKRVKLGLLCAESFKRVVDGQGIEISWIKANRFDVSEEEYLQMAGGKTSALIGLACEAGAMLGGAGKRAMRKMRSYGEKLGAAFQIQDDVLNVSGEFEKYKKEIGGDITEGKRTLIVVHCLSRASAEDRGRLTSILVSHSREKADIEAAISLFTKYGSIEYARQRALGLVEAAKRELASLGDSESKQALVSMADYAVRREQ